MGYVLATAEDKSRVTAVTDDPEFLRMVADSSIEPGEGGIDLPGHKFPWTFHRVAAGLVRTSRQTFVTTL